MTRLGEEVSRRLRKKKQPLVEDWHLWAILEEIYEEKAVAYLRGDRPTHATLVRVKDLLRSERVISRDHDYSRVWRVTDIPDIQADEVVCLLDEGTCLSHLSAMQKFNLTERRPQILYITLADHEEWKALVRHEDETDGEGPQLQRRHHPELVRSRRIDTFQTNQYPRTTKIKSSFVRVTEIGETFLDMLEQPDRCGGMSHVLDVYARHAKSYLPQIIDRVDSSEKKLTKVRAGYILTEMLGMKNEIANSWAQYAQRGGSQRLDPKAPYKPTFSEKWMISLNV